MIDGRLEKESKYLNGESVWGDDLSEEEIALWYRDEEKGYYNLFVNYKKEVTGSDINEVHSHYGFSKIANQSIDVVLGLGSADGKEFLPIIDKVRELNIVEISEDFYKTRIGETRVKYIKPNIMGTLPFDDMKFDLIMASKVLHHIPNITYVCQELVRCLKPGGILLLTEPIVYMGGFEGTRTGLTLRERGIPIVFFDNLIRKNDMKIISRNFYNHILFHKLLAHIGENRMLNSKRVIKIDEFLCRHAITSSKIYHTTNKFRRAFQASNVYLVLERKI